MLFNGANRTAAKSSEIFLFFILSSDGIIVDIIRRLIL